MNGVDSANLNLLGQSCVPARLRLDNRVTSLMQTAAETIMNACYEARPQFIIAPGTVRREFSQYVARL